jgi:hypothetical protein
MFISWNVDKQFASWNLSMQALVTLPLISFSGETYFTDGYKLCGYQNDDKPFGPCVLMEPVTGPLFDMTVVTQQFLYLLYKCGFMVAYFISGMLSPIAEILYLVLPEILYLWYVGPIILFA